MLVYFKQLRTEKKESVCGAGDGVTAWGFLRHPSWFAAHTSHPGRRMWDAQLICGTCFKQESRLLSDPDLRAIVTVTVQCFLTMVGVWKENSDKCSRIAAETSTPIKVGQRRSRVGVYGGRSANEGYKSSWWSSSKSVSAWEETVEAPPGLGRGQITTGKTVDPMVECLTQILQEKDVQAKMDAEGYVSIRWLLKVKSALNWECGGNAKSLISAVESQVGIQLDEAQRRVRLRSCSEQLLVEAKRLMQQLPFGVVPLSSFFGLPSLSQMQKCSALDAEGLLRKALTRDSELVIQGAFVAWQPRAEKLRKSVEQLFLEQDSQLHSKIQQSGDVPLTWIVGRYAKKLGLAHSDVRSSEALAEAVAGALQDSQVLRVDRHRLTVRKCRSPERAPEDPRSGEMDRQEGGERKGGRAASQLRQLLDFYFEPFTLQHNRYLLDLILKRADAPQDKGPWRVEALQNCRFTWEDLQGLGRIQSALTKLQSRPDGMVELGDLKHLSCDDGQFHLRTKLEVRNFVHAENVSKDVAGAAVRYLTASREQQQEAPKGVVNVMSYAVAEMMTDQSPVGQQRLAKVKRQILVYRTDVICLQIAICRFRPAVAMESFRFSPSSSSSIRTAHKLAPTLGAVHHIRSQCHFQQHQTRAVCTASTVLAAFLRRNRHARGRATAARRVQGKDQDAVADDGAIGDLQMAALAKVPKSLWPLLMDAAEAAVDAEDISTASTPGGLGLAQAISSAAEGVATWRQRLTLGRIWRDEEGANWPKEDTLRRGWQDLLREKGLPQLVKKYPKLVDPLMASLLEIEEQFHEEMQEVEAQKSEDPSDDAEAADAEGQQQSDGTGDSDEASDGENGDESQKDGKEDQSNEIREAVGQKLMEKLSEELGPVADAINAADSAFGAGAGQGMVDGMEGDGFGLGQGQWHQSLSDDQNEELLQLAKIMRASPELRELLRNLGRRSAVRGPLHKLPEEIWYESGPEGVIRSPAAPAEATGVTLSGNWDTMLPSEAQLLAAKSPMLRTLHHARRIEQSLLCYDRSSWLQDDSKTTGRSEIRPLGKAGPLIVCLDTSGSMMGDRELLSKALVVECVRQAHRQRRPCYLYAFAGAGDLNELELDLSQDGLRKVLDFLRQSFGGGTYLEDALAEAAKKLEQPTWQNADLLIVTDGELNANTDEASIASARSKCGTKVTGLVLADTGGAAMERLCDELYLTGRSSFRGEKGLRFPKLQKGVDANEKIGASLATSLVEEGYGLASNNVNGEANCILWDRRRWERVREDVLGDALAVELKPYEDPETSIRVVCWRANVHNDSSRLFGAHEKVLVCTDLSSVGGAEAAGIVDELVGLPSVAEEVLGEEVAAHIPAPPGLSLDDCELAPVRSQGLNRLRHPDAVFFLNMTPVTALSGHTTEYLEKMPQEDVVQQFPCFRLPIVAAFDWQNSDWAGAKRAPSHAADHVRL
eukprot:s219_g49.t1